MFARIRKWWRSRHTTFEPIEILPLTDEELDAYFDIAWSDPDFYWNMSDWGRAHKQEVKAMLMPHLKETWQTKRRGD
jgi:hypothetical protein